LDALSEADEEGGKYPQEGNRGIIEPVALDSTSIMVDKSRLHLFSGTLVGRRGWVRVSWSTEIPLGYKTNLRKIILI
jgi:hypothetical protein